MQKDKIIKVTFRMRESVHEKVKMIADKDGISLNSALHQRVVRDLENENRRNLSV